MKAHVTCVRSLYELDPYRHHRHGAAATAEIMTEDGTWDHEEIPNPAVYEIWPDIAQIPHSNTGHTQSALYRKQLSCAGVRLWDDGVEARQHEQEQDPDAAFAAAAAIDPLHLRIFAFQSDQGPDQAQCRKIIIGSVRAAPDVIIIWQFCMLHMGHLITERHLRIHDKLVTKKGYWSSVATIVNTWRVPGNAKRIFKALAYPHDVADDVGDDADDAAAMRMSRAKELAGRLPPRPLTGRWGSIHLCEQFLLKMTFDEMTSAFADALCKSHGVDDGAGNDAVAAATAKKL
eukprot:544553-Pyramimonas_sp.AAC.1